MKATLHGRNAVITGGSQGLGAAIARVFLENGARVMITGRETDALQRTASDLARHTDDPSCIATFQGDVGDARQAEVLAAAALASFGSVQILVNNAGIYGPMGSIDSIDPEQWIAAVRTNLFGSVFTARAFLPHMRAQKYGKIVQLSGGGATSPMPRISAYAASKAAVVRFAESLALDVAGDGIDVNALAPGALNTRMLDELIGAGPETIGADAYRRALEQQQNGGASFERAAALALFLASAESDGITGRLLSAVWDPWEDLASRREALAGSDIYTLRRILARDRGLDWGER
ncbi:MAG: SDR family oxidoreductase [Ignavibacteriae bacterium]|nr:SDR family oxidoreductase [Ignavibacteriota bacterium]